MKTYELIDGDYHDEARNQFCAFGIYLFERHPEGLKFMDPEGWALNNYPAEVASMSEVVAAALAATGLNSGTLLGVHRYLSIANDHGAPTSLLLKALSKVGITDIDLVDRREVPENFKALWHDLPAV